MPASRGHRHLAHLLGLCAVLGYVWLIEHFWGWDEILARWDAVGSRNVSIALVLLLLTYVVRALRVADYFRRETGRPVWLYLRITLIHNLFNNLLPMRSGEASFPLLMKHHFKLSLTRTSAALLWLRLIDLHAIVLLAGLGVLHHLDATAWWYLGAVPLLALPAVVEYARKPLERWLRGQVRGRADAFLERFFSGLPASMDAFWRAWGLTWLNWVIKLGLFAWILGLFAPLSPGQSLLGAIGGEISSILPFHAPGGLGTYEAGVVAAAGLLGANLEAALVAGINLHLLIIVGTLLGGGLALLTGVRRGVTPP